MTTAPQIQVRHVFEWDTPWSFEFLIAVCVIFVVWTLWQLMREGQLSKLSWWILFFLTRTTVAGVLLWMLLGPTSVLIQTESQQRTLAVYIDNSSSMQFQDPWNFVSDRRWQLGGNYQPQSLTAVDRVAFFASALKQQSIRLSNAFDQQIDAEDTHEIAEKWRFIAGKCDEWLHSDTFDHGLTTNQKRLHQELQQILSQDLMTILEDSTWMTGRDPGGRDQRMKQLIEVAEMFVARCRTFADELANHIIAESDVVTTQSSDVLPSRLQQALPAIRHALSEWMKIGKEKFQIRIAQFSESVTSLPLDHWDSSLGEKPDAAVDAQAIRRTDMSELFKQIRDDAGKDDIAAAVILTDGRHTADSVEDPRDVVGQLRIPVYPLPVGHGEMTRDVILRQVHAPVSVIQNDKILIDGIVMARQCKDETSEIRLFEGDKVIDTVRATFKSDQDDQRFRFEIPADAIGRREFKIDVETLPEEHSFQNNHKTVAVDVTDAVLRILLADGRSRWEHQYLVNVFNRQESIALDQLKFTPVPVGTGRLKNRPRFPETTEEWGEYRVVILGDVSPRQLSHKSQEALRDYVTHQGGSVIIIAGQNGMPHAFQGQPLEQMLPVEDIPAFSPHKQGYRVELSAEGKTSDVMQFAEDLTSTEQVWRETCASLPIYYLSTYHKPKPNSQVFLNAVPVNDSPTDNPAFLCWQTVGAGRVAFFSSPATYQLRNRNGDKYHHRFWGQLIRWIIIRSNLTGSKCVKIMADKSNYNLGDTAQLTVELTDTDGRPVTNAMPVVDVLKKGDVVSNVNFAADSNVPGRYLGSYTPSLEGKFSLRARGSDVERLLKAENYVDPVQILIEFEREFDREMSDSRTDRPLLEYLAEQTGGVVLQPTALAELTHAVALQPRIHESSQKRSLWDRWWCLWVILGCLTLEWVIRKQVGLA